MCSVQIFRRKRLFFACFLALIACRDRFKEAPLPVTSASALPIANVVADAAANETTIVDPPAPAGDLRAELERFTRHSACVAARASIDPLLADAVRALGYERFLSDACTVLEAGHFRDRSICTRIEVSSMRTHCETFVAVVVHEPNLCPWQVERKTEYGRDPICIAWASSDPRICRGAETGKQMWCEAITMKNEKLCAKEGDEARRSSCARDVRRWKDLMGDPVTAATAGIPAIAKAQITGLTGSGGADDKADIDLSMFAAHGVVLIESATGLRFELGEFEDDVSLRRRAALLNRPDLSFAVTMSREGTNAVVERLQMTIPGQAPIHSARAAGGVIVEKADVRRGGEIHLRIEGSVGAQPPYRIKGDVRTFVRDIVTFRDWLAVHGIHDAGK